MSLPPATAHVPSLLLRNCRVHTCDEQLRVHDHGAVFLRDGRIEWLGAEHDVPAGLQPARTMDLTGRWVTPGLVDCHTHLVYAGQRAAEFARRTSGTSYVDIAREGGGILSTVRATRAAPLEALVDAARPRLESLLAEGVTTVEIKSGYGLEYDTEIRQLEAARRLEATHPVTVATTLLAAHALPPEYVGRADDYVDTVCDDWLPRAVRECSSSGQRLVDAVDVYCEDIAFSAAQCARIFTRARELGLPVKLHAEQLSNVGGTQVAARHGALSCDHLEYATDDDVAALARAGTVAVMLPLAYYILAEKQLPPLEALRRHGVPLAVASDSNPGTAPGASLLLAMNMARRLFGLSSTEVLLGTTRHAARALGLDRERGSLVPGRVADLAVWSIDTPDELGYWAGYNPCSLVVQNGAIVLERNV